MKNLILPTGELVQTDFKAAVIRFETPRKVMSTSVLNGGIQKGLTAVFNYDELQDSKKRCEMRAKTYKEHLEIVAKEELGLLPEKTTGLTTAAQIKNMADCTMDYDDFKLMTIVTAGVSVNGLRAGDPATLHQKEGEPFEVGGTINIILSIDADLTDGAMLQALMTCTEAKTAALQELLCPSQKSREIATGTGTDGVIIIANPDASVHLTDSGKHFKLGEYIGKAVKQTVKEALFYQEGLCPDKQHTAGQRLKRYGIVSPEKALKRDSELVVEASLLAHLLDQYSWNLLSEREVLNGAEVIFEQIEKRFKLDVKNKKALTIRSLMSVFKDYLNGI